VGIALGPDVRDLSQCGGWGGGMGGKQKHPDKRSGKIRLMEARSGERELMPVRRIMGKEKQQVTGKG